MKPAGSDHKIFHGWIVVAAAFMITLVGFGSAYTFSAFFVSWQHEFGASRGSTSLAFSLAGFLYFGLGMFSGPLADRWGARPLALIGMALTGIGLILASRADTLFQAYAAYSLGVGCGVGASYVPAVGAVQRWFVKRRGFASGLAVSGIGVGTLLMPPLATWLIAAHGWRQAYLILGILALILGCAAAFFIEDEPRARGLAPDGGPALPQAGTAAVPGLSIGEAIRTPVFLGLYGACLVCALGVFVPFVHLVPYALDHGVSAGSAALLLGAVGVGSTIGRFLLGDIADRIDRRYFLVAMFVGMAASLLIWGLGGSFWMLATFALLFGLFYGGWVAIMPTVAMDYFGGRNVSGIIGILYTSVAIGALAGPSAAGFAFDIGHSYTVPILASAAADLIAAAITLVALRRHRHSPA